LTDVNVLGRLVSGQAAVVGRLTNRPLALWTVLAAIFFLYFCSSALILPLSSGPDEQAHFLYSAGVARGQTATLEVSVPAAIENIRNYNCIAFKPDDTAACQSAYAGPDELRTAPTHVGLYNPVFYFWTGLGSLIVPNQYGLYIARFLSAVVSAGLLAGSLTLLLRSFRSTWVVAGFAVLFTPMVAYMCSVLNPSGWEITSALAVTVAGFVVFRQYPARRGWTGAHSLLVVAGCVLMVSRGLSPVIGAMIFLFLALGFGWSHTKHFFTRPANLITLGVIGLVGIASLLWTLRVGTNFVGIEAPDTLHDGINGISVYFTDAFIQIPQYFGFVGWLDLPPPTVLVFIWMAGVIAFVAVSSMIGGRRPTLQTVLFALVLVFFPAVLSGLQWSGHGWQGRYSLPIVVSLILLAAMTASDSDGMVDTGDRLSRLVTGARRRFLVFGLSSLLVFHISILVIAMHRYMRGNSAAPNGPIGWFPPVDHRLLLAGAVVALLGLVFVLSGARPTVSMAARARPDAAPSTMAR
jgi:hypothetical protein